MITMAARLLLAYYLATPVFLLIDLVWQAPLRVAFIQPDSILLPIWGAGDSITAGGGLPDFGPLRITNALLTGTMLVAGFHARQAELLRTLGHSGAKGI
jgi:hypothetical protein